MTDGALLPRRAAGALRSGARARSAATSIPWASGSSPESCTAGSPWAVVPGNAMGAPAGIAPGAGVPSGGGAAGALNPPTPPLCPGTVAAGAGMYLPITLSAIPSARSGLLAWADTRIFVLSAWKLAHQRVSSPRTPAACAAT